MRNAAAGLIVALTMAPAFAAQEQVGSDFPAFVWCQDHVGVALPESLVEAFGGVNVEGPAQAQWVREHGLDFYVGHAPGRNALHIDDAAGWYAQLWTKYWEAREPTVLVREPCLSQVATWRNLEARLSRSLLAREGATGRGVSLGDEVGLTRYGGPLDLCYSEECRAAHAKFIASSTRWGALAPDAGEAPGYPDTNTARRAWTDGDPSHVAAWMARREFHHELFVGVLARLSERSAELAPEAPVGLVGLAGRTPFGGVGVEAVLPLLDFVEVYPTLDSRELLYSLRGDRQQSWCTVFREEGSEASAGWQLREHWLRGGEAAVLWSDRELLAHPDYLEDAAQAVADVRALRKRLPGWRPAPRGLAIVHDPEAMYMSWLRDALHDGATWPKRFASYQNEHGTREVALRGLLRLAEDAGLLPGALPFESIGAETVARFPLLVLNEQVVLEERELERLEAFVAAGGRLLVHGRFDVWSLGGLPSELGALARLEALNAESVQRFEFDAARYLAERCKSPRPYALRLAKQLALQLDGAELQHPSWRPQASGVAYPWLLAEGAGDEPGTRHCAAIPNLQYASERSLLRDVQVRIEGVENFEIEWLAPRQPGEDGKLLLRAGEVLVFKLKPR